MSTEIAKPRTPMEEFQDNLKKSLRDDIARMIPEEVIADMIKRVIEEEFFKKRETPKPGRGSYSSETILLPSAFQEMVVDAAKPVLEREAAKIVEKLEYKIAEQIKETVEAGASAVVLKVFTDLINNAFMASEFQFKQNLVELLKRNGLNINSY